MTSGYHSCPRGFARRPRRRNMRVRGREGSGCLRCPLQSAPPARAPHSGGQRSYFTGRRLTARRSAGPVRRCETRRGNPPLRLEGGGGGAHVRSQAGCLGLGLIELPAASRDLGVRSCATRASHARQVAKSRSWDRLVGWRVLGEGDLDLSLKLGLGSWRISAGPGYIGAG